MDINETIVQNALLDEGKREIKGNRGWADKQLDLSMRATGWQDGHAWCSYWCEKVWNDSYNSDVQKVIARLFSANAVETWHQFWESPMFDTYDYPIDGAIVIWQHVVDGMPRFIGETQWLRGHAGIVIDIEGDASKFTTLEGNSNSQGGREGIEVARQERSLDFEKQNGLRLLGFIHPLEV